MNRAITVIGTGNTPLDMVGPVADRDYFYDGPLGLFDKPQYANITDRISPIASTNFQAVVGATDADSKSGLDDEQVDILRSQIKQAKKKGIGARYWGAPYYPIRKRNAIWRTLLDEGVALLNADDLDAATGFF